MLLTRANHDEVEADLLSGRLSCPFCGGWLAPWGYGTERELRSLKRATRLRPRRAICSSCRKTQVLLPPTSLPRRRDSVEVILEAWRARVAGAGLREIATLLARPLSTVRRWLGELAGRAEQLRCAATRLLHALDHSPLALGPAGSPLADALDALGHALAASLRRLGPEASSPLASILAAGGFGASSRCQGPPGASRR
ncbi:MAG: transposase [Acidimicrobiales bacterium]